VLHFFRNVVGVAVVDKEVFSRRTADYQAWVEAFARNHRLPIDASGACRSAISSRLDETYPGEVSSPRVRRAVEPGKI
jgi:hypothetical protein